MHQLRERIFKALMILLSTTAIVSLLFIALFVTKEGAPIFPKAGLGKFLLGQQWKPSSAKFGVFPMIVGSIYATLVALVLSVPFGVGCAVFLNNFAPRPLAKILRPAVDLLAGIPSVVYGLFGLIIIVPFIGRYLGGDGLSLLATGLVLCVMVLPTIVSISLDALKAVPSKFIDGSLALGASKWQTIFKIILPSAKNGILAAVVLGMGRAIGETMAVLMVIGNTALVPKSILTPARTLTSNIALEMGYAAGDHRQALFATGIILFVMIMVLTSVAGVASKRRAGD